MIQPGKKQGTEEKEGKEQSVENLMSRPGGTVSDERLYLTSTHPRPVFVSSSMYWMLAPSFPLSVLCVRLFCTVMAGSGVSLFYTATPTTKPLWGDLCLCILRLRLGGLRRICFSEFRPCVLV